MTLHLPNPHATYSLLPTIKTPVLIVLSKNSENNYKNNYIIMLYIKSLFISLPCISAVDIFSCIILLVLLIELLYYSYKNNFKNLML